MADQETDAPEPVELHCLREPRRQGTIQITVPGAEFEPPADQVRPDVYRKRRVWSWWEDRHQPGMLILLPEPATDEHPSRPLMMLASVDRSTGSLSFRAPIAALVGVDVAQAILKGAQDNPQEWTVQVPPGWLEQFVARCRASRVRS